MTRRSDQLPNTDIPDKNYPDESINHQYAMDRTSFLSQTGQYGDGNGNPAVSYTDKYFQFNSNESNLAKPYQVAPELVETAKHIQSLTGAYVSPDDFRHENMVPFFGGKVRGLNADANVFESTLDAYTGAGSQHISKQEQSPMFEPLQNLQFPHGMPDSTDFIQSRVEGNVGHKFNGELPFQQYQVAPGLGLGAGTEGVAGYNNGMLARELYLEKSVDELRTKTNPKSSEYTMLGYETAPQSRIQNAATIDTMGRVEKNRPDTSFEMGADRLFRTMGAFTAETQHGEIIDRHVTRPETLRDYTGVAGLTQDNLMYTTGEYMPSKHQDLGALPIATPGGIVGKGDVTSADYGTGTNQVFTNNRVANDNSMYFGAAGSLVNAVIAPVMDIFRPTRKGDCVGNVRIYGDAGKLVPESYVFDGASNAPGVTNRQMKNMDGLDYARLDRAQFQDGTGYISTPAEANPTLRGQHAVRDYTGPAKSATFTGSTSYESGYAQTIRGLKNSQLTGFTPNGGTDMFNTNLGAARFANDAQGGNSRELSMTRAATIMPPSMDGLGQSSALMAADKQAKWKQMNDERQNKDILMAFLSNPYTHNIAAN
jgi:hypothetical protein